MPSQTDVYFFYFVGRNSRLEILSLKLPRWEKKYQTIYVSPWSHAGFKLQYYWALSIIKQHSYFLYAGLVFQYY